MEVEAAVRRVLLGDPTVNGYVVGKVFRNRLEEKVDGTGGRAIVVARNNGWATPDPATSQEYPIVVLKFYADPDRDVYSGGVQRSNAEDKALAVYRAADKLLHAKRGVWMGAFGSNRGLMVVTSARASEPVVVREKDRHGEGSGDPLGDSLYVMVEYNMQVVH